MKDTYPGQIVNGFLAGMMISLGGTVYLACYQKNVFIGALLFSMGLLVICWKGYSLYTGKIGLLYEAHTKEDISVLLLGLLGNFLATVVFGFMIAYTFPDLKTVATIVCTAKLATSYARILLRAVLCGILIYLAVDIYRNNKTVLGILFCIPAFILSGYEHSIADMFYFAVYGIATAESFGIICLVLIGNSIGGLLIPTLKLLEKIGGRQKKTLMSDENA